MRGMFQSWLMVAGIGLVLVTSLINTCQTDRLEHLALQNAQTLKEIQRTGVAVRGSAARGPSGDGFELTEEERKALTDPENVLEGRIPFVQDVNAVPGGTLRLAAGSDPQGLNPYIATGADAATYNFYISSTLGRRRQDDPDRWIQQLAIKVVTPDQGKTFEVTLRKGALWSKPVVDWGSGKYDWLRGDHELTSDDFKFGFQIIENQQVTGRVTALRNYFQGARFEEIDRYRFRIIFAEPSVINLPSVLDLWPMPRWLYQFDEDGTAFGDATWGLKFNSHWYNNRGIGVGPYRFVDWTPGVKLEFAKNETYWGAPIAFDRLLFFIVKDQQGLPRKLKTGELDYIGLQPEQYKTLIIDGGKPYLNKHELDIVNYPTTAYYYLGWNMDRPMFADKRVRRAMTHAFDRESIVKSIFHGLGKVTTGPYPQQNPCYDRGIPKWPYDLKRAAELLDEAGWRDDNGDGVREKVVDGKPVPAEITLTIYGSSNEYATIANIFREDLLKVGVKLNPRPLEWSTMLKKISQREFDGYTGAWVTDWETDLYQLWHSKEADRPGSSNYVGFRQGDELIERLRASLDPDERVKICHQFHELVHELQPYTFFFQRNRTGFYWNHLNTPTYKLTYPYADVRHWSFNQKRP